MKHVAYSLGRSEQWLEVAQRLRAELGWEPRYWITQPASHAQTVAAFPACVAHPFLDLCRGIAAPGIGARTPSLGELAAGARYEATAIELIDRVDLGRGFAYDERQRLYKKLMMHALGAIEQLSLELAVFNVPPHSVGEYVLYVACRVRGVPVRVFRPTPVNATHFIADSAESLPRHLYQAYERRLAARDCRVSAAVLDEIETIARATPGFRPWYMTEVQEREERHEHALRALAPMVREGKLAYRDLRVGEPPSGLLKRRRKPGDELPVRQAFKRPGVPLDGPVMSKWEYRTYLDWAALAKLELERRYRERCAPPDFSRPCVYFAMHYQPERTSCPDGDRYSDHYLAIATVAGALPAGWRLYVKEHPSQFNYRGHGELARWNEYYDDIAALPNVQLVDTALPSIELIDRARAVATVAGAAGWEALVRGKPALCFGAAWYGACRGAFRLESPADARAAFERIAAGERPAREDVLAYAGALEDIGRVCYTNTSLAKAVDTDEQRQKDALFALLHDFETR